MDSAPLFCLAQSNIYLPLPALYKRFQASQDINWRWKLQYLSKFETFDTTYSQMTELCIKPRQQKI
jgi:hypothetical protein